MFIQSRVQVMDGEARVTNTMPQEHLDQVLVIGDFGVGMAAAVILSVCVLNLYFTLHARLTLDLIASCSSFSYIAITYIYLYFYL